ncbi:nuclear pore glycoprotein p62 [Cylas formicarius]|uniref:nuclear pore glycoprotein p62 n=1 Tax=Cylas formicarius TaxID=197179 RepID=UPI0029583C3C|nr:nuclear pore glycoprotein p62 [Cylas formicarius]
MSLSFGAPSKTASGFTLPTTAASTAVVRTPSSATFQMSSGSGDNKLSAALVGAAPISSSTSVSFGIGQPKVSASTFNFTVPATATAGATAPTSAPVSIPSFNFGSPATSSSSSFTPIVGTASTTTSGFSLGSVAATTTTTSQQLKVPITASISTTSGAATLLINTTSNQSLANTQTTTTKSSIPAIGSLTFAQVEDSINKWTIDLEEQGKFFVNQAKQLNAWDSLLISNGEKILNLNSSIERVKQQQNQLDQELDFVLAQQKELEELLIPLEKELLDVPVTDFDRNQMYQFAEIIDSQLKQISDDLKEIIENINESNKDEEITNPITQISKILNSHMNSLQWIDQNTAQISSLLEEISKIEDSNRRNLKLNNSFNNSINIGL